MFTQHKGEHDALQLAKARSGALLLTDDTSARLAARTMSIEVHGTVDIVVRAIRRGQRTRSEVVSILEQIPERSTLFIKSSLLEDIVRQVRSGGD